MGNNSKHFLLWVSSYLMFGKLATLHTGSVSLEESNFLLFIVGSYVCLDNIIDVLEFYKKYPRS